MRIWILAALAAAMLSFPAAAEDGPDSIRDEGAADVSFQASRARLLAAGFRNIKTVNGDVLRLKARDRSGSFVQLSVDPLTGEISEAAYVYAMDE